MKTPSGPSSPPLLEVRNLSVVYGVRSPVPAVRGVSVDVAENEFLGLVGESGCGKSTLGFAIARLLRPPARRVAGTVRLDGWDFGGLSEREIRPLRWSLLSIVLQSGMNAWNPVMTIGAQFLDAIRAHGRTGRSEAWRRAEESMALAGLSADILRRYPHELSGGMKQRAAIALAMVLEPKLAIFDEPTTALDVVVQRQIVDNLRALRKRKPLSAIFISHDLGLVLELADRVAVMYAGELVEIRKARDLLERPMHPYTKGLLRSIPDFGRGAAGAGRIPGGPPDLRNPPPGCPFALRCESAIERCRTDAPDWTDAGGGRVRCHAVSSEVVQGG